MVVGRKRTPREKWRLTSLSNKVITIATVVIAFAGAFAFGAALLQWSEMRASGKQTDQLISLYREQVNKLGQQTEKLGQQVAKLGEQVGQTHELVNQAIISNSETVDALHKSERPWITAESFEITPPIALPTERVPMLTMGIEYRIRNTGKSVATNGWSLVFIQPNAPNHLTKEWLHGCDEVARIKGSLILGKQAWPMGFILAPGETKTKKQDSIAYQVSSPQQRSGAFLYFIGCAVYDDQFDITHHTTFCYQTENGGVITPENTKLRHCDAFEEAN